MNKIISIISVGAVAVAFASCKNSEQNFPDFDGGTTAYFAYQYPIRTLILGNVETYDNTSDNEGRFTIYSTCGGSYSGLNAKIDVNVDESLTQNLYFEDGVTKVTPMPKDYYTVSGEELDYAGGFRAGVEIKLNEKFFNDPLSVKNTYVIPMVMGEKFSGVDKINRGTPVVDGTTPLRQNSAMWDPTPKDYTMFCVNYINEYTATYLRRGVDEFPKFQFEDRVVGTNTFVVAHATAKKNEVWDNQFWINVDHVFAEGEDWSLAMNIKATKEASSSSQIHIAPGEYKTGLGTVNFSPSWTRYTTGGTFSADQAGGHSIAFNLNDLADANDYYFDSVSFIIGGVEYITNIACNEVDCDNYYSKIDNGATVKSSYESEPIIQRISLGYTPVKQNRRGQFIENDEVVYTRSESRNQVVLPIATTEVAGIPTACELLLTFSDNGDCTVASNNEALCTATGTGKYVKNGAPKAWGNKDRDVLYLDYTINFKQDDVHYATKDTLVWRDRGAAAGIQTFKPVYKED